MTLAGIVPNAFVHIISFHPRVTWTDVGMEIGELGEAETWRQYMTELDVEFRVCLAPTPGLSNLTWTPTWSVHAS